MYEFIIQRSLFDMQGQIMKTNETWAVIKHIGVWWFWVFMIEVAIATHWPKMSRLGLYSISNVSV